MVYDMDASQNQNRSYKRGRQMINPLSEKYVWKTPCILATAHLTATPRGTGWTEAVEAANFVMATAAFETRLAGALVHVRLTAFTPETRSAHTLKPVHQVLAERESSVSIYTLIFPSYS